MTHDIPIRPSDSEDYADCHGCVYRVLCRIVCYSFQSFSNYTPTVLLALGTTSAFVKRFLASVYPDDIVDGQHDI